MRLCGWRFVWNQWWANSHSQCQWHKTTYSHRPYQTIRLTRAIFVRIQFECWLRCTEIPAISARPALHSMASVFRFKYGNSSISSHHCLQQQLHSAWIANGCVFAACMCRTKHLFGTYNLWVFKFVNLWIGSQVEHWFIANWAMLEFQ